MDLRTAETTLEFAEEASAAATGPDAKVALERLETRVDGRGEFAAEFGVDQPGEGGGGR